MVKQLAFKTHILVLDIKIENNDYYRYLNY